METLPGGKSGGDYSVQVTATGTGPITWAVSDGSLPEGLTLSTENGIISGKPVTAGDFTFTLTAANARGEDSRKFTLKITESDDGISGNGGGSSGGCNSGMGILALLTLLPAVVITRKKR